MRRGYAWWRGWLYLSFSSKKSYWNAIANIPLRRLLFFFFIKPSNLLRKTLRVSRYWSCKRVAVQIQLSEFAVESGTVKKYLLTNIHSTSRAMRLFVASTVLRFLRIWTLEAILFWLWKGRIRGRFSQAGKLNRRMAPRYYLMKVNWNGC